MQTGEHGGLPQGNAVLDNALCSGGNTEAHQMLFFCQFPKGNVSWGRRFRFFGLAGRKVFQPQLLGFRFHPDTKPQGEKQRQNSGQEKCASPPGELDDHAQTGPGNQISGHGGQGNQYGGEISFFRGEPGGNDPDNGPPEGGEEQAVEEPDGENYAIGWKNTHEQVAQGCAQQAYCHEFFHSQPVAQNAADEMADAIADEKSASHCTGCGGAPLEFCRHLGQGNGKIRSAQIRQGIGQPTQKHNSPLHQPAVWNLIRFHQASLHNSHTKQHKISKKHNCNVGLYGTFGEMSSKFRHFVVLY